MKVVSSLNILIIAAFDDEVELLKEKYEDSELVDVFVSGVAFSNAAKIVRPILQGNYDLVLNVGVAGSLEENIEIGAVYSLTNAIHHDIDITALGVEKGRLSSGVVSTPIIEIDELNQCAIASGSKFISEPEERLELGKRTGAKLCDMETAIYASICDSIGMPFYAIRSVSDTILDGEEHTYEANLEVAIKNAQKKAIEFIEGIEQVS